MRLKFLGIILLLLVVGFQLIFLGNVAYGEYKEMNIKIVVLHNKARVTEQINPRTIVSTINIQPISTKISHILATDEKNTVLVTSQKQNMIRIDTLGASHVILTYDADIVKNTSGVATIDYNSTNLESSVILPSGSDIVSVNNVPNDIKNDTITMPAGYMSISYVIRTVVQNSFVATTNGIQFPIGVITASKIEKFGFDSSSKTLFMNIDAQSPILVIVPKSLLAGPYDVQLNGKFLQSKEYYQNSTHAWIRIDPSETGTLKITNSAMVIPEFFPTSVLVLTIAIMSGIIFEITFRKRFSVY